MVSSLVSRQEFYARQSEQFVEDAFQGSLPAFLAAFGSRKKLTEEAFERRLNSEEIRAAALQKYESLKDVTLN